MKTRTEIWVRSLYWITVNILVILYYNFVGCHHWGKEHKGYMESLYYYSRMCIYNCPKIKEIQFNRPWDYMRSPKDIVDTEKGKGPQTELWGIYINILWAWCIKIYALSMGRGIPQLSRCPLIVWDPWRMST